MALVLADRVKDTTTTTGTGTITLSGTAPSGFQNFSVIGNGNTTYYTIASGSAWEVGIGTYSSTGPTLSRDTVLSSSASGSKITLSGTSDVFVTYPAEKSVNYDASNNVGIGTTSPATKLQVSAASGYNEIRITSGSNNLGLAIDGGAAYLAAFQSMPLAFQTNSAERMRIDSAGNVGIATSIPASTLQVDGANASGATLSSNGAGSVAFVSSTFGAAYGMASRILLGYGQTSGADNAFAAIGAEYTIFGGSYAGGALVFGTGGNGRTSITERMRISATGNVGVGTSAPQGLLHVVSGTNDTLLFRGPINLGTGGSIYAVNSANSTVTPMEFGASAYYFAGGYVGIGTSSPTNMLSVAGTINSNNLLMQGDGSNAYIRPTNAGSSLYLGAANSNYIQLASDGSTYFNVGGVSNTHQFLYNESGGEIQLVDSTGAGPILLDNSGGLARLLKVGSGSMAVGTTSTGFLRFQTADTERMRIDGSGNVGIGTSSPASTFEVISNATPNIFSTNYADNTGGGNYVGRKSRGTISSPTAVLADDQLVVLLGRGYTSGGAFSANVGAMGIFAAENFTSTDNGTYITFATTATGATTRSERLRIGPAGQIGLSGANYGTSGQVLTSNGSGSAPTWQASSGISQARATALSMILGF